MKILIEPDFIQGSDHTETWGDILHPDIFPAVYRTYRAPVDRDECEEQIKDLGGLIREINDQYEEVRANAIKLGLDPNRDRPTRDQLKRIRSGRNRAEAARRAYLFWLEGGDLSACVKQTGRTQYSLEARINTLADALKQVVDIYIKDVSGEEVEVSIGEELALLRRQLEAVFAS